MWWWLACSSPPPAPEILVFSVDTLRTDRLGFAGHDAAQTPRLDALASRGRVFVGATTPLPRTTPGLASLQTGLAPHHHGSREVGTPIGDVPTLASTLQQAGWQTAAVSAMTVAGPEQGLGAGFDTFDIDFDAPARRIVERAERLIRRAGPEPLYLWVHVADPHFPYAPAEGPAAPTCRALQASAEGGGGRRAAIYADRGGKSSAALADCQALYDAEIAAVDEAFGRLLDTWTERRGTDGWVVFTADHGENQGEQGLYYEHGPNVADASLRVPLVVAGPGVVPGPDTGVASLTDVAPTLLGQLGMSTLETDGEDLGPRLAGGAPDPSGMRFAESGSALHATLFDYVASGRARRFCTNGPQYSLCRRRGGPATLHDHTADPALAHDLSASLPEVRARLEAAALRWPPESARERTVRTARFKLVARPQLEGGYADFLFDVASGMDISVAQPEERAQLRAALDAWEAPTPEARERGEEEVQALRELGYVE